LRYYSGACRNLPLRNEAAHAAVAESVAALGRIITADCTYVAALMLRRVMD